LSGIVADFSKPHSNKEDDNSLVNLCVTVEGNECNAGRVQSHLERPLLEYSDYRSEHQKLQTYLSSKPGINVVLSSVDGAVFSSSTEQQVKKLSDSGYNNVGQNSKAVHSIKQNVRPMPDVMELTRADCKSTPSSISAS